MPTVVRGSREGKTPGSMGLYVHQSGYIGRSFGGRLCVPQARSVVIDGRFGKIENQDLNKVVVTVVLMLLQKLLLLLLLLVLVLLLLSPTMLMKLLAPGFLSREGRAGGGG